MSLFHLTGTPRVLIFKALHLTDRQLFPAVLLLRRYRLCTIFFQKLLTVPYCLAAELTFYPTLAFPGPLLQAAGFRLEIQPNLEVLIPVKSASYAIRFHPSYAMTTLMTFCPSGYPASATLAWPSSYRVCCPLRVLELMKLESPSMRSPPPMEFLPYDIHFLFRVALFSGYWFPSGSFCLSPDICTLLETTVRLLPEFESVCPAATDSLVNDHLTELSL